MDITTVSFDYDETLVEHVYAGGLSFNNTISVMRLEIAELLKEYYSLGCRCIIVTARSNVSSNFTEINQFLESSNLKHMISKIIFTNHALKGPFLFEEGVSLHYDDDLDHLRSAREYGIIAINSMI